MRQAPNVTLKFRVNTRGRHDPARAGVMVLADHRAAGRHPVRLPDGRPGDVLVGRNPQPGEGSHVQGKPLQGYLNPGA